MLYITISAFIFAITFFIPKLSLFTMTTFLIPLMHSTKEKLFFKGYVWGVIVFGAYWYWIVILFKNQSLYYIGTIFWIISMLWCSLFSGLWLVCFKKFPVIASVIFFIFLSKAILFPLGQLEGIPLLNPLVLISEYKCVVKPLYYLGDLIMLCILFWIQCWIARKIISLKILYGIALLMIGIFCSMDQNQKKYSIQGAAIITPWWYNQKKGAMFTGYRLAHAISDAVQKNNTKIIINPE